jgi:hypothetical protein
VCLRVIYKPKGLSKELAEDCIERIFSSIFTVVALILCAIEINNTWFDLLAPDTLYKRSLTAIAEAFYIVDLIVMLIYTT